MAMRYTQICDGVDARVHNSHLYVRVTDMRQGRLVSGGYADRVYRMMYEGSLADAQKVNDWGVSDLNRCIENGTIIRKGRIIH